MINYMFEWWSREAFGISFGKQRASAQLLHYYYFFVGSSEWICIRHSMRCFFPRFHFFVVVVLRRHVMSEACDGVAVALECARFADFANIFNLSNSNCFPFTLSTFGRIPIHLHHDYELIYFSAKTVSFVRNPKFELFVRWRARALESHCHNDFHFRLAHNPPIARAVKKESN